MSVICLFLIIFSLLLKDINKGHRCAFFATMINVMLFKVTYSQSRVQLSVNTKTVLFGKVMFRGTERAY